MKQIGSKNYLGITYRVTNVEPLMGYGKIWFGGNFIGTDKDLIYINGYLLSTLKEIRECTVADFDTSDKDLLFKTLYERLNDHDDFDIHDYLVRGATFTDYFYIFSFRDENYRIHILWKLRQGSTFSDLKNASRAVHYFTVPYIEYAAFFDEAQLEISNYGKNV